jgi:hypothetical protein
MIPCSWWSSGNVLAFGPKVRGFKPGQGQWFLRDIKFRGTPSFGWEVKLSASCCKILQHVKERNEYERAAS